MFFHLVSFLVIFSLISSRLLCYFYVFVFALHSWLRLYVSSCLIFIFFAGSLCFGNFLFFLLLLLYFFSSFVSFSSSSLSLLLVSLLLYNKLSFRDILNFLFYISHFSSVRLLDLILSSPEPSHHHIFTSFHLFLHSFLLLLRWFFYTLFLPFLFIHPPSQSLFHLHRRLSPCSSSPSVSSFSRETHHHSVNTSQYPLYYGFMNTIKVIVYLKAIAEFFT